MIDQPHRVNHTYTALASSDSSPLVRLYIYQHCMASHNVHILINSLASMYSRLSAVQANLIASILTSAGG